MKFKYLFMAFLASCAFAACNPDNPDTPDTNPGGDDNDDQTEQPTDPDTPGTDGISGEVSGVWEAGSTVSVSGHIVVPEGKSLTIEEGVTVIFSDAGTRRTPAPCIGE